MSRSLLHKTVRDRKIVIALQLSVLLFILVGLFGSTLLQVGAPKNQPAVDLDSVAPHKTVAAIGALDGVSISGRAAYVWDVKAGQALYEKNSDTVLPLASLTKLMTSMLAYELLSGDTEATVTSRALNQDGDTGLTEGERLTLESLTRLSLISSSNDAAYALAAAVGSSLGKQDATAQFVAGMNIRANELGLSTLVFENPTGLDVSLTEPGAVGSARDISLLMEYILENYPEVLESTQRSAARVYSSSGGYHDVENTNDALYAIPNLLGSKTGYTDLAGGNLIVAFDAGFDRPIIVTVLGSTREGRFTDVLNLVAAVRSSLKEGT